MAVPLPTGCPRCGDAMREGFVLFANQLIWGEPPEGRDWTTEVLTPRNFAFGRLYAHRCAKCEVVLVEYSKPLPGPSIDSFL